MTLLILTNQTPGHNKFYAMLEDKKFFRVLTFWGKIEVGVSTGCSRTKNFHDERSMKRFVDDKIQTEAEKSYSQASDRISKCIVRDLYNVMGKSDAMVKQFFNENPIEEYV